MLENSLTFSSVNPENSCSSISKHDSDRETKMETNRDDSCKVLESAHKSILDELIDDAILDVCFEVHRNAKLACAFDRERNSKNQQVRDYQPITVCCPICHANKGAEYFTGHLAGCMGVGAKRKARQKVFTFEETDDDSDELYSDSEYSKPGSSKKKYKRGNKNSRKQSKLQGNSVSKYSNANMNYQLMSHEEKRAFYDENCGVISKRTKRPCTKTLKCSLHTDEQRRDVRNDLRRDMGDQITNEEDIDIQSIDDDVSQQIIMPSSFTNI